MTIGVWILIFVILAVFVLDWLIVMGTNPKNWKGGEKDDSGRTDRKV